MKISILTLNPGVDRVIYLDAPMTAGGHNRYSRAVVNQGSKGANQAILLNNLGDNPVYFTFTGGQSGELCESFVKSRGIGTVAVPVKCGVRLNIKVIEPDGTGTELNETGGPVTRDELDSLLSRLYEEKSDIVSLCGSFPQGVEKDVYYSVINRVGNPETVTVLDCSGEALVLGAAGGCSLIKPNRTEIAAFGYGVPQTAENALSICGKIHEKYGCDVICTLDSDGSVYAGQSGAYRIRTAPRELHGFSGAGDSYLAAYIHSRYVKKTDVPSALAAGAAAACAKIALYGSEIPDAHGIEESRKYITVEKATTTI